MAGEGVALVRSAAATAGARWLAVVIRVRRAEVPVFVSAAKSSRKPSCTHLYIELRLSPISRKIRLNRCGYPCRRPDYMKIKKNIRLAAGLTLGGRQAV